MIPALLGRRSIVVPCTLDLEASFDSFHAYVDLEGAEVGPGDSVLVHDAPTAASGERRLFSRRATVVRATWPERLWTRLTAYLELTELYEVGFQTWRAP